MLHRVEEHLAKREQQVVAIGLGTSERSAAMNWTSLSAFSKLHVTRKAIHSGRAVNRTVVPADGFSRGDDGLGNRRRFERRRETRKDSGPQRGDHIERCRGGRQHDGFDTGTDLPYFFEEGEILGNRRVGAVIRTSKARSRRRWMASIERWPSRTRMQGPASARATAPSRHDPRSPGCASFRSTIQISATARGAVLEWRPLVASRSNRASAAGSVASSAERISMATSRAQRKNAAAHRSPGRPADERGRAEARASADRTDATPDLA